MGKTKLPQGSVLFMLGFLLLIVLFWAHAPLLLSLIGNGGKDRLGNRPARAGLNGQGATGSDPRGAS